MTADERAGPGGGAGRNRLHRARRRTALPGPAGRRGAVAGARRARPAPRSGARRRDEPALRPGRAGDGPRSVPAGAGRVRGRGRAGRGVGRAACHRDFDSIPDGAGAGRCTPSPPTCATCTPSSASTAAVRRSSRPAPSACPRPARDGLSECLVNGVVLVQHRRTHPRPGGYLLGPVSPAVPSSAVDPASVVDRGSHSYHNTPWKPDPPRSFPDRGTGERRQLPAGFAGLVRIRASAGHNTPSRQPGRLNGKVRHERGKEFHVGETL